MTTLPQGVIAVLSGPVSLRFNSYFSFTATQVEKQCCIRSREIGCNNYEYPNDSLISDLTMLWSLFCEVYEAFPGLRSRDHATNFARVLSSNQYLMNQVHRILEGEPPPRQNGAFWRFNSKRVCGEIPLAQAKSADLDDVLRTLRNGFAHFHWRYENLSALDYWNAQGWDTTGADPRSSLLTRTANNYLAYVVDALPPWNDRSFWKMNDLRILVTPFPVLRYHLHLILNYLLNDSKRDVFGADTLG
jgi:hypothetical protein